MTGLPEQLALLASLVEPTVEDVALLNSFTTYDPQGFTVARVGCLCVLQGYVVVPAPAPSPPDGSAGVLVGTLPKRFWPAQDVSAYVPRSVSRADCVIGIAGDQSSGQEGQITLTGTIAQGDNINLALAWRTLQPLVS